MVNIYRSDNSYIQIALQKLSSSTNCAIYTYIEIYIMLYCQMNCFVALYLEKVNFYLTDFTLTSLLVLTLVN